MWPAVPSAPPASASIVTMATMVPMAQALSNFCWHKATPNTMITYWVIIYVASGASVAFSDSGIGIDPSGASGAFSASGIGIDGDGGNDGADGLASGIVIRPSGLQASSDGFFTDPMPSVNQSAAE
ncbi:hypothetical protein GGX14DRAFT_404373 [Mycena pura]|uniref:Uncharacterized protein n=1 Tax=Mycena pura TaxID=153505 RepID=A0AAD6V184_9AGAR|nr:hypothetical protein GGX14DRAFT_404373 [Mycena pura]